MVIFVSFLALEGGKFMPWGRYKPFMVLRTLNIQFLVRNCNV